MKTLQKTVVIVSEQVSITGRVLNINELKDDG
jgi:hypothetical protein